MRFWTFFLLYIGLYKFWTFWKNCRPFSMPQGSEVQVDRSVYAGPRGPEVHADISQNIQKIDYRAFTFSRRHYAADNHTARDIPNFGPFWVVKIQGEGGGECPLLPDIPDQASSTYSSVKLNVFYLKLIGKFSRGTPVSSTNETDISSSSTSPPHAPGSC